ncbi:PP2C family protein-serine/threonine phosphatase [Streptomyces clavuligerus]|uniref:Putative membrane protein n=1 Tax=Streptomyces clavuligerus TaxID=1901 RepID=D5SLV1_STRCL|nr:PP2C family protein-serine/threonine phosphatase [Streptomyces clavuligerus]EFG04894.1 Putative membrane protein [Streptomyces clavuligerus]MBY6306667.1 serine/threonine-protein phosphatase [Streptomyces clavuligerus]QCS10727.1 serine/threonine-protein phosphatase [Streptomyces clavuligerus]QPJ97238.1 SpoIIE family protein phosphatase [Streptomyces clavuligerus]WDN57439.1 serine/threonine-protein phosphatase [Streptomyces clavuligerus]
MLLTRHTPSGRDVAPGGPPSSGRLLISVAAVTVLVVVVGGLAHSLVWLIGFMVFLPAASSALCTVRQTIAVCVWTTLVVAGIALVWVDGGGSPLDRVLVLVLTGCLGTASVYACHRRIARENEMLRLRSVAGAMQRQFLRPFPLLTADVLVNGVYEPLHEDRLVGGDVYDVVESPWGTRILIGDVQGKGLAAVGAAFAVIGAFRTAARREAGLTAVVAALDAAVTGQNLYAERAGEDERFVTALVVTIGGPDEVQAVNCGHLPPHLLRAGSVTSPSLPTGVPLGLTALADEPARVGSFPFPPGTTLVLSTDGLMEARAADGTFYPVDERLERLADLAPDKLPGALYDDVRTFTGDHGQQDDIAVLTVHRPQHHPPR